MPAATSSIPSTPAQRNRDHEYESETQQQQHNHNHNHEQQQQRGAAVASSSAFALRKQWEAKLVSLQRGMEHVQHCRAGDACGSSLCHSTRRLMQTYENHQCPSASDGNSASAVDCKVCKLWDFLMTRRTQMAAIAQLRRPLTHHLHASSVSSSSSCRGAAIAGSRRSAASVYSRVLASQKEAHHLSARRRF